MYDKNVLQRHFFPITIKKLRSFPRSGGILNETKKLWNCGNKCVNHAGFVFHGVSHEYFGWNE